MKNILYVALGIIVITLCVAFLHSEYNNAVDECVKGGNSYNYCANGLK